MIDFISFDCAPFFFLFLVFISDISPKWNVKVNRFSLIDSPLEEQNKRKLIPLSPNLVLNIFFGVVGKLNARSLSIVQRHRVTRRHVTAENVAQRGVSIVFARHGKKSRLGGQVTRSHQRQIRPSRVWIELAESQNVKGQHRRGSVSPSLRPNVDFDLKKK